MWVKQLTNNQFSQDENDDYYQYLELFLEFAIVSSHNNVINILIIISPVLLYLHNTTYTSVLLTRIERLVRLTGDQELIAYYNSIRYPPI